jgi:hypothetical protein
MMDASQEHSRFGCAERFKGAGNRRLRSTATVALRWIVHETLEGGDQLGLEFLQLELASEFGSLGHH